MSTHLNLLALTRNAEKQTIKDSIQPRRIIQVCGPPMTGKSFLVQQAIEELRQESGINPIRHDFWCENILSFDVLLYQMVKALVAGKETPHWLNENEVLLTLRSLLGHPQLRDLHHIFIFHKCESFRTSGHDNEFFTFLWRIVGDLSPNFKVSVIFTTYKKFHISGEIVFNIVIEVMSDPRDVSIILQTCAPSIPDTQLQCYVDICLNTFPFPEIVQRIAEEFLANDEYRTSPEELVQNLESNHDFLKLVFNRKLWNMRMADWISTDKLCLIMDFTFSFKSSFSESDLDYAIDRQGNITHNVFKKFLRDNFVRRELPVPGIYVLHPLIVFYCKMVRFRQRHIVQSQWYDQSCNRYADFFLRVLQTVETKFSLQDKKGHVCGGLAQEWPHVRLVIEQALHCNTNIFFLKAAVSGRAFLMRLFGPEVYYIYWALYEFAKWQGTPVQRAMLQAIIGHLMGSSARLAKGGTWQEAEYYLDSAILTLKQHGPLFACLWATTRKGILLDRQGKQKDALRTFGEAKRFLPLKEVNDRFLEETFGVSGLQVKEETITLDIYEGTCLINSGDKDKAYQQLLSASEKIRSECSNHMELVTLLNSMGLLKAGKGQSAEALEWYYQSYLERMRVHKFAPEMVVVTMLNIGDILLYRRNPKPCMYWFQKALDIRRRIGSMHKETALLLLNIGIYHLKCGNIIEACKVTEEADDIFSQVCKDHYSRLKANNLLGHYRRILEIQFSKGSGTSRRLQQTVAGKDGLGETMAASSGTDLYLEKSAYDYFHSSVKIAGQLKTNYGEEGLYQLGMSYAHAMLICVSSSREAYTRHQEEVMKTFHDKRSQNKLQTGKLAELYKYITSTSYEHVDPKEFLQRLEKSCYICQISKSRLSLDEMWGKNNFNDKMTYEPLFSSVAESNASHCTHKLAKLLNVAHHINDQNKIFGSAPSANSEPWQNFSGFSNVDISATRVKSLTSDTSVSTADTYDFRRVTLLSQGELTGQRKPSITKTSGTSSGYLAENLDDHNTSSHGTNVNSWPSESSTTEIQILYSNSSTETENNNNFTSATVLSQGESPDLSLPDQTDLSTSEVNIAPYSHLVLSVEHSPQSSPWTSETFPKVNNEEQAAEPGLECLAIAEIQTASRDPVDINLPAHPVSNLNSFQLTSFHASSLSRGPSLASTQLNNENTQSHEISCQLPSHNNSDERGEHFRCDYNEASYPNNALYGVSGEFSLNEPCLGNVQGGVTQESSLGFTEMERDVQQNATARIAQEGLELWQQTSLVIQEKQTQASDNDISLASKHSNPDVALGSRPRQEEI